MSHTQGQHVSVLIRRQEQTIPETARPPAGTAHALQERRDGRRRIDLNHAIKIATVVNFPSGDLEIVTVVAETEAAIRDGADEIDLVIPYKKFIAGDETAVAAMIAVLAQAQ